MAEYVSEITQLSNEIQLHIPEEGISALSNELLDSFENSNLELIAEKKADNSVAGSCAEVVADHYNNIEEKGVHERKESRIFHMRNLNNWIKSRLIARWLKQVADEKNKSGVNVLDLGCGKGGDLLKFQKGPVSHVICADIAETSVDQCKERYKSHKHRFTAEFVTGDCSKVNLKSKFNKPETKLDIVSCQFAFHYSFESLPQAEQMLANVSSNLEPGGYFIGTTTDAFDIIRRLNREENPSNRKFGNEVFSVEFPESTSLENVPLFGAKYNFHLEGVVDCPEFLVHFPTFQKLASRYGLKLVKKTRFEDFVKEESDPEGLLVRMNVYEAYPPYPHNELVSKIPSDYSHAEDYLKTLAKASNSRIGTLTKAEWEATSLYLLFVFQKQSVPQSTESEST